MKRVFSACRSLESTAIWSPNSADLRLDAFTKITPRSRPVSTDRSPTQARCIGQNRLRTGSVERCRACGPAAGCDEMVKLQNEWKKNGEPKFQELEPNGGVASRGRCCPSGGLRGAATWRMAPIRH